MNFNEFKKIVKLKEKDIPKTHKKCITAGIVFSIEFAVDTHEYKIEGDEPYLKDITAERATKELYWYIWGKEKQEIVLKLNKLEDELTRICGNGYDFLKISEAFLKSGIKSELLK